MDLMQCTTLACVQWGDDSVSRAAYFCSEHMSMSTSTAVPPPLEFEPAWQGCHRVFTEWRKSSNYNIMQEARAAERRQIELQRQFVDNVASTLK